MFWLKYIQGLISTLNEDVSPNEIAAGVVLGAIIGLAPKTNLLALGLWVVVWIFRVNITMATAAIVIFAIVGHLTDPFVEKLGYWLLAEASPLKAFWTALYNLPIVPFTSFNNTLVMGNLAFGILLAVPIFFAMKKFVLVYRARYRDRLMQSKAMKLFKASKYFDLYGRFMHRGMK